MTALADQLELALANGRDLQAQLDATRSKLEISEARCHALEQDLAAAQLRVHELANQVRDLTEYSSMQHRQLDQIAAHAAQH